MSNGDIERLIYYKGQVLTADDFNAQQAYHRDKLSQFVQRFPKGIVTGLHVFCSPADQNNPDDYDAFKIEAGLALDEQGQAIVVPDQGYRVNVDEFRENEPYL